MDHNTLFAKTPPGKLFVLAALPGAIGMLASALYRGPAGGHRHAGLRPLSAH